MYFEVSGVQISPVLPFLFAFLVSFFTSMGGVSGAFLVLPFQVSVLGFTGPAVSSTNLVYNLVAIPSGVYRYIKEGRMAWPLACVIMVGTLPGVFMGAFIRIKYLLDPKHFKLFVGCVLLYIGLRLLYGLRQRNKITRQASVRDDRYRKRKDKTIESLKPDTGHDVTIKTVAFSITDCTYSFYGETFSFNPFGLFMLTLVFGIIGGTYGIGGGSIIAPLLVAFWNLPVHTIAGATLLGTLSTSAFGVVFYMGIAPYFVHTGLAIRPDWLLGTLFGAGGFAGIYCGARLQKYMPAKTIKIILALVITILAAKYILDIF
jgi:hypothetical protein